jgi:hypothetical protein
MRDINLTPQLMDKYGSRFPRTRGRYSASDVFFALYGGMTPEEWFFGKERQLKDVLKMFQGIMVHDYIQKLLDPKRCEIKTVKQFGPMTIVGKCDYLPEDPTEVWEFKTNEKTMCDAKEYQLYQTRLYTTMSERETGVVYQPVQSDEGIFLKFLGECKRDDGWFMQEMGKMMLFHFKVEAVWEKMLAGDYKKD